MVYNDNYYRMVRWVKCFKLIENRVSIINELAGSRSVRDAVATLSYARGSYDVTYRGDSVASFRVYDLAGIDAAFTVVDTLADGLWPVKIA